MKTEVIKLNSDRLDIYKIRRAVDVVNAGGIAAFPTETVYGLACRATDESLARLSELKGRDADKHYTLHIGDKNRIAHYVPQRSLRENKLIDKAWPGPLTIVFQISNEDISTLRKQIDRQEFENLYARNGPGHAARSLGVRCPAHPVAASLLNEIAHAVVAPSANYSGAEPAVTAEQVSAVFDGTIEIILDAGPTKYRAGSTIAKIGKKGVELLRQGYYSREQIVDFCTVNILVVCTGNTCRSPMAEGLFKKLIAEKLLCPVDQLRQMGYKISSAGTIGVTGWPASSEAVAVSAANGIDISGHSSSVLTEELLRQSDLIYVMSRNHLEQVARLCRQGGCKGFLLAGDREVPDPIGQDVEVYKKCFAMLEESVAARISELKL